MRTIYVQIPAYRDEELLPTVVSLRSAATRPDRLRIGLAWQYGPDEERLEKDLLRVPGVDVVKIPAAESCGCNWARGLLQARAGDERYTLLLDSHHRFAPGWDEATVDMFEDLRSADCPKPILSGYLPPYQPDSDPAGRVDAIYTMREAERCDGLLFRLVGDAVRDRAAIQKPFPGAFASLHFLFADGVFNREVPADPAIYFFADEVAIGLRAFTHGYDVFQPHRVLGWHQYDRSHRVPHWRDHPGWRRLNRLSLARLRALYSGAAGDRHGIGSARSIAAFEARAGLRLIGPGDGGPRPASMFDPTQRGSAHV
jgi:hypothetical protein